MNAGGGRLCFFPRPKPLQAAGDALAVSSLARTLGVPVAAYYNRPWLTRIPDVATQLIFGGSPGASTAQLGHNDSATAS